jgi:hypothetical protein
MVVQSTAHANPYVERLIGSLRRECLDHVIVLGEAHLRRVLAFYSVYYQRARTHLALEKDAPVPRRVQAPTEGRVIAFPEDINRNNENGIPGMHRASSCREGYS